MRTCRQMWSGSWLKNWRILMTHLRKESKLVLMMMISPLFLLILRAQVRYCQVIFFAGHAVVLVCSHSLLPVHSVFSKLFILLWKCLSFWQSIWQNLNDLKFLSSFFDLVLLYILWSEMWIAIWRSWNSIREWSIQDEAVIISWLPSISSKRLLPFETFRIFFGN